MRRWADGMSKGCCFDTLDPQTSLLLFFSCPIEPFRTDPLLLLSGLPDPTWSTGSQQGRSRTQTPGIILGMTPRGPRVPSNLGK